MKKIFSTLLVGTASLAAVGATSLSIVSCGSGTDNTSKYAEVLKEAVAQVITAKRTETATVSKDAKKSFEISISDITKAADKIISDGKLDINDSYFKHLYIFGSFTTDKNNTAHKDTVHVSQNSSSRPTSITINYDNTTFSAGKSTDGTPSSSLIGEISIDIKERHLLVMKKLLTTIDYNLNNTSYFNKTAPTWGKAAPGAAETFINGNNGKPATAPKTWLAVSANPTNPMQLIGVSKNSLWFSDNGGVAWSTNKKYTYKGVLSDYLGFTFDGSKAGMPADTARIVWHGTTAYISASQLPGKGYTTAAALYTDTSKKASVGDLWICRLGGKAADHTTEYVAKTDSQVATIMPFLLTGYYGPQNINNWNNNQMLFTGNFDVDSMGNLIYAGTHMSVDKFNKAQGVNELYATDIAKINNSNDTVWNGVYVKGPSTKAWVGINSANPDSSEWYRGGLKNMSISPNGKAIWLAFNGGYVEKVTVKNPNTAAPTFSALNSKTTGYTIGGSASKGGTTTIVASNTGVYGIISGDMVHNTLAGKIKYTGFLSNDMNTENKTTVSGNTAGTWSYGYMDSANNGKNAFELLSTGNKNQTYIIDPNNTSGELIPATLGNFSGFYPDGTIINPNEGSNTDKGLIFGQATYDVTGQKSALTGMVQYLSSARQMYNVPTDKTAAMTHISALSANYGYLSVNGELFDTAGGTAPTKVSNLSLTNGVPFLNTFDGTSTPKKATLHFINTANTLSNTFAGLTITYKGSALSWTAPGKFI